MVTILINKHVINEVNSVKYLGILLDSQLPYKNQINALSKKVSRAIAVLYKLRPFVTSKTLISVYYAIIYPFLLYGIVLCGNLSTTLINHYIFCKKK